MTTTTPTAPPVCAPGRMVPYAPECWALDPAGDQVHAVATVDRSEPSGWRCLYAGPSLADADSIAAWWLSRYGVSPLRWTDSRRAMAQWMAL